MNGDAFPGCLIMIIFVVGSVYYLIKKQQEREQERIKMVQINAENERNRQAINAENERKRKAFEEWYSKLPPEQQYIIDRQMEALNAQIQAGNAQARSNAMLATMGMMQSLHNLNDLTHHH